MKLAMGSYTGGVDADGWYERRALEGVPDIRVLVRPCFQGLSRPRAWMVVEAWHVATGEHVVFV